MDHIAHLIFEDGAQERFKGDVDRMLALHPRSRALKVLEGYSHAEGRKLTLDADVDRLAFSDQTSGELGVILTSLAHLLAANATAGMELMVRSV